MHYRKTQICRVSRPLPSARTRALGKNLAHGMPGLYRVPAVSKAGHSAKCLLCRVLARQHSAKPAHVPSTRARRAPPVRGLTALSLCQVPPSGTRQRRHVAECLQQALGKEETLPSALAWLSAKFLLPRVLELRHSAKLVKKKFLCLQIFLVST